MNLEGVMEGHILGCSMGLEDTGEGAIDASFKRL